MSTDITLVKCVVMDREETPYVYRYGRMRRTARKSVDPGPIRLKINHEPEPPPIPAHPAPEYDFAILYDSEFSVTQMISSEPSYHPDSDPDNVYSAEPMDLEDEEDPEMTIVFDEPLEPGSPTGSTLSSVGDNLDYPGIREIDEEEASPDELHYYLNGNTILTQALYLDFQYAEQIAETTQEKYLIFLRRVKYYYKINGQFVRPHPPEDWVLSTLHHFPHTRFWVWKINDLLEEGPIDDAKPYLQRLKYWVRQHM